MTDERVPSRGGLMPSSTRELTMRSSSLVRRGLESLLAQQAVGAEMSDPQFIKLPFHCQKCRKNQDLHVSAEEWGSTPIPLCILGICADCAEKGSRLPPATHGRC